MLTYTVEHGDTAAGIAAKLTGNPRLATQLMASNPEVFPVQNNGTLGAPTGFQPGSRLRVPWLRYHGYPAGMFGAAPGFLGQDEIIEDPFSTEYGERVKEPEPTRGSGGSCNNLIGPTIEVVKPYVYVANADDIAYGPSNITKKWGNEYFDCGVQGSGHCKWKELRQANADEPFIIYPNGVCWLADWYPGKKLRVPDNWPKPPASLQSQIESGGKPQGTAGGGSGSGEPGLSSVNWVKGGGGGLGTVAIVGLAGLAGVAGWLLLKKKR